METFLKQIRVKQRNWWRLSENPTNLIRVCYDKSSLFWKIVIYIWDNLNRNISFASSWRTNNHCQTRLHSRLDGFNLGRCEWYRIPTVQQFSSKFRGLTLDDLDILLNIKKVINNIQERSTLHYKEFAIAFFWKRKT